MSILAAIADKKKSENGKIISTFNKQKTLLSLMFNEKSPWWCRSFGSVGGVVGASGFCRKRLGKSYCMMVVGTYYVCVLIGLALI